MPEKTNAFWHGAPKDTSLEELFEQQVVRTNKIISFMLSQGQSPGLIANYLCSHGGVSQLPAGIVARRIMGAGGPEQFIKEHPFDDVPDATRTSVLEHVEKADPHLASEDHFAKFRPPTEADIYQGKLKEYFDTLVTAILGRGKIKSPPRIRIDSYTHNGKRALRVNLSVPSQSETQSAARDEKAMLQEISKMQVDLASKIKTAIEQASQNKGDLAALFQGAEALEEIQVFLESWKDGEKVSTPVIEYPIKQ